MTEQQSVSQRHLALIFQHEICNTVGRKLVIEHSHWSTTNLTGFLLIDHARAITIVKSKSQTHTSLTVMFNVAVLKIRLKLCISYHGGEAKISVDYLVLRTNEVDVDDWLDEVDC